MTCEACKHLIDIEDLSSVDKYFVFSCDGRTCVIVPAFPPNHRGEV